MKSQELIEYLKAEADRYESRITEDMGESNRMYLVGIAVGLTKAAGILERGGEDERT